ncbi:MarR family transcriptional regulator [bacterium]|nr:MarR family transcriptional regulator [bacterium]
MPDYDFEESIGYWLAVSNQAFQRSLSERLSPEGITHRQTHVIGWLKLEKQLSQGDLARKMMIEPPTLVRILDRMEAAGWVRREGDPNDRRRRIVRLADAAEPVWERIVEHALELRQAAVVGMSSDEVALLKTLLRKIFTNLAQPSHVAVPLMAASTDQE